jgi:hypothetical protein
MTERFGTNLPSGTVTGTGFAVDRASSATGAPFGNFFAGKRALITGGMGFLGGHVVRRLVGLGAEISTPRPNATRSSTTAGNGCGRGYTSSKATSETRSMSARRSATDLSTSFSTSPHSP